MGKLIIADFDRVSPSNLNRQLYFADQIGRLKVEALRENLERIGGYTELIIHPVKLEPSNLAEIFGRVDLLIEAFDRADQKAMLLESWCEAFPDRYYIGASGLCGVGRNEELRTEQYDKVFLIGDGYTEPVGSVSPVSARVAVVAAMQANLALELLLRNEDDNC